jgi:hypothetical protein
MVPATSTAPRGGGLMRTPTRHGWFLPSALAVIFAVAFVVSGFASSSPDGLEKVAADTAIDDEATDHALARSPLADYGVKGVDDERLGTGVAGMLGVTATLAAAVALFVVLRRRCDDEAEPSPPPAGATR